MQRPSMPIPRLIAGCLLGVAVRAIAADLPADARIDHVMVYRQGAMVTRVAQVSIPAGSQRLIFRGLPADVDPKGLQFTVGNAAVQLGDIEVVRINEANFVSEPERELRRRIEENVDQQSILNDEVASAESQLKLMDSLASNPAGNPSRAAVDAANLTAVLGAMASGESSARKRVRDASLQLRTLARQKSQLQADLAKVATTSRQSTEVRASVEAREVLDRVPVSKNGDVRVEILKGATEPSVKDLDGNAGVWLWKFAPPPQQTVTVHQAYAIEYPAGRQLQEINVP